MSITSYLAESGVKFKTRGIKTYGEYIADFIKETFNKKIELSKDEIRLLEHVINGQGQEKDKITSPYSSSLQSFLIFRKVSKENPIKINDIEYDKVDFEVKNPVINYPSSIDVKLSNDNKDVLFIESKLYEVIRDSNKNGMPVIGPSYFSDDKNGYLKKLKLSKNDLQKIGIIFPLEDHMYGQKASDIKKEIIKPEQSKEKDDGYVSIQAIEKDKWVYSYGIKQILSHIIGILNYKGSPLKQRRFAYLYNELPDYEEKLQDYQGDSVDDKIKDYNEHVNEVFKLLKDKPGNEIKKSILTYQELYQKNPDYFKNNKNHVEDIICIYYKLNKKRRIDDRSKRKIRGGEGFCR